MRLLVTGANGFVGRNVVARAMDAGLDVRCAVRRAGVELPSGADTALVAELDGRTEWGPALQGVDAIVHTAARVHVMRESAADAEEHHRRVNTEGTLNLARQAVAAGVRRFVFVSTVKVNGERTEPGRPFTSEDAPAPTDAYSRSKLEAERGLRDIERTTPLGVTIVRPPLVYGPGVGANFRALMRLIARGIPLPFGAVDNRRSLVAVENLASLLVRCAVADAASGATFFASDAEDLSTPELVRRIAAALGRQPRLISVPPSLLMAAAGLVGRGPWMSRLCGSLQVDSTSARRILGWVPPRTTAEALRETVEAFKGGA